MSCQDQAKLPTETSQNLGVVCPDETPKALKAIGSLCAGLAKGYKHVRPTLRVLKKKAEAGDALSYRLLLQAAFFPETLAGDNYIQSVTHRTAMEYIFDGGYAALGNPATYIVAMLKSTRPVSVDTAGLSIRVLREMKTTPAERAFLIGWIIEELDGYKMESGEPIPLICSRFEYLWGLMRMKDGQGDLHPIFIRFLQIRNYEPCSFENLELLKRFRDDKSFPAGLTDEQGDWLREHLAGQLQDVEGRSSADFPTEGERRSRDMFIALAKCLINRLDARDIDDEGYLREFYLAGRGEDERAKQAVRAVFARDFASGLVMYRDGGDLWQTRLNRLVLDEAARRSDDAPHILDDYRIPAYLNLLRRAVQGGEGELAVRGYAACLRSPAIQEVQRIEVFIRLRAMEREWDQERIGQQYAAYRVLDEHDQLPPKLDRDTFRRSLTAAPALTKNVTPAKVPRGALVRGRRDGGIYIALGVAGRDFDDENTYLFRRRYFRQVMDGNRDVNRHRVGSDVMANTDDRFDILVNDQENPGRAMESVLEWGDGWDVIDNFMKTYRPGDRGMAERLALKIGRRCGTGFDLIVDTASGQRRYPLKYYRAYPAWDDGKRKLKLECLARSGDDVCLDLDEIDTISLVREPAVVSDDDRPMDDVDDEVYVRLVRAGLRPPAEIVNQRPDLVLKYGV